MMLASDAEKEQEQNSMHPRLFGFSDRVSEL